MHICINRLTAMHTGSVNVSIMKNIKLLLCIFAAATFMHTAAQVTPAYTTAVDSSAAPAETDPTEVFRPTQLILPGALIGVGVAGAASSWVRHRDKINKFTFHEWPHFNIANWYNVVQYGPSVVGWALPLVGVKSRHPARERLLVTITTYTLMASSVYAVKNFAGELRPNGKDRHSFPSGHTATAFAGAEIMRREYGGWWGVGAYLWAASVGIVRACSTEHWATDVIGGAGFGILSARAAYWLLPIEKKLLGFNKHTQALVTPYYNPATGTIGAQMAVVF